MEELYNRSWVQAQVAKTIGVWDRCGEDSSLGGERYSLQEQMKREEAYDDGLHAVEQDAKRASRGRADALPLKNASSPSSPALRRLRWVWKRMRFSS